MKILLVEDDENLADVISETLLHHHYLVEHAGDGQQGLDLAELFPYDLILLDVCLPSVDGLKICKRLREQSNRTPILLMTGEYSRRSIVAGLDAGADDYLAKPIDLEELLARIRALLRRRKDQVSPVIEWGLLCLYPSKCQVTYGGDLIHLTAKEYELLELFLRNPDRIYSQSLLLDRLWSFEDTPSENAVRTQIKGLRQKLKKAGAGEMIETLYGLGYRLKTQPKQEKPLPQLAKAWAKSREKYLQRVKTLETAIVTLRSDPTARDSYTQAQREAHTLAGSLGSFGLKIATQFCRQIEDKLQHNPIPFDFLQSLLINLGQQLEVTEDSSPDSSELATDLPGPPKNIQKTPYILMISSDRTLTDTLTQAIQGQKMDTDTAFTLEQAKSAIAQSPPDLILLDLRLPQSLKFLADLNQRTPPIPVVVLSETDTFSQRLQVARLGGLGFLPHPIEPQRAIATLQKILDPSSLPLARLLVVDDDTEILDLLTHLLEPWGFILYPLHDPQQFWDTLERVKPDLLLLDIKMPHVSGIELCQIVRSDPDWGDLPILMLSAYRTPEIVQQVFLTGADDYIQKPIVAPELLARILNRLERRNFWHKLTTFMGNRRWGR
ncbi:response regulator [Spirulina sp. CS-785/01]|uniref:response regulator n=1 Tax=Spirulina sp. CS-785/01 TaxID=3021716 RepID=UPI00232CBFE9|nr:response regulator [Spirulina sp. CS-785/01]MDB9314178.1 response regulator [Spirulina sp. CS-785/01]